MLIGGNVSRIVASQICRKGRGDGPVISVALISHNPGNLLI